MRILQALIIGASAASALLVAAGPGADAHRADGMPSDQALLAPVGEALGISDLGAPPAPDGG